MTCHPSHQERSNCNKHPKDKQFTNQLMRGFLCFACVVAVAVGVAGVCSVDSQPHCSASRVAGLHYLDDDCPVPQCHTKQLRDPMCPDARPFCTGDRCIECINTFDCLFKPGTYCDVTSGDCKGLGEPAAMPNVYKDTTGIRVILVLVILAYWVCYQEQI